MHDLLRAAVTTGWGNALLAGAVSLDEAAEHAAAATRCTLLHGAPQEGGAASWPVVLGRFRSSGADRFALAAPVPGDPLGLAGPPELTARAVAAGGAVMVVLGHDAYALLPSADRSARSWQVEPAVVPPYPPTVGEAGRALSEAVRDVTRTLEQLDVARGDDRADAARHAVENLLSDHPPPPTTSSRAGALLATAARLLAAVEAASDSDGGAVSAQEALRRQAALAPLSSAARGALVAAASEVAS